MKVIRITSAVELTSEQEEFYKTYHVRLPGGIKLQVDHDEYLDILARQLPDDELVWSINERRKDPFFRPGYPEWSVVPNPRSEVAGNIYFTTKGDANRELVRRIERKMESETELARQEVARLQAIRDAITATEEK